MESCPACGNKRLHERRRAERPFKLAGIFNIILHDVTVINCPGCSRSEPVVPDADGLARAVARAIVGKRQRLSSSEIRFLRKQLGLSGIDLAMHLGTTPESVSRWEHGRTPMGTTADRLLRLMVVVAEGTVYPLNSLRTMALDGPRTTLIHVRRHDDRWEASFGGVRE
jgi:putative zinc finger/helix-turn-helix YgiT family protein